MSSKTKSKELCENCNKEINIIWAADNISWSKYSKTNTKLCIKCFEINTIKEGGGAVFLAVSLTEEDLDKVYYLIHLGRAPWAAFVDVACQKQYNSLADLYGS